MKTRGSITRRAHLGIVRDKSFWEKLSNPLVSLPETTDWRTFKMVFTIQGVQPGLTRNDVFRIIGDKLEWFGKLYKCIIKEV